MALLLVVSSRRCLGRGSIPREARAVLRALQQTTRLPAWGPQVCTSVRARVCLFILGVWGPSLAHLALPPARAGCRGLRGAPRGRARG